jgi:hypothetical protein
MKIMPSPVDFHDGKQRIGASDDIGIRKKGPEKNTEYGSCKIGETNTHDDS